MKIKANALSIKDKNGTYHGMDMVIPDMKPLVDEIEKTTEDIAELKDTVVKTVNNITPDANGNVNVQGGGSTIDSDALDAMLEEVYG